MEHDHMIEALATNGFNHSLDTGSLPRRARCRQDSKGLVLLSLDENEEPQKASDFGAQHKLMWPNYHLDKQSLDKFPSHGIPFFLMIDSSGNIVFSHAGLDEEKLRAALASLGYSSTRSQ
jgi:hypothetical protein